MRARRSVAAILPLVVGGCHGCGPPVAADAARDAAVTDLGAADVGLDAGDLDAGDLDAPDVFDAADVAAFDTDDGACRALPIATPEDQVKDASCGDGCTVFTGLQAIGSTPAVTQRASALEFSPGSTLVVYDPAAGVFDEFWHMSSGAQGHGMCTGGSQSLISALTESSGVLYAVCVAQDHWELHALDHTAGTECTRLSVPFPATDTNGSAPTSLLRLQGAFAWLQSFHGGPEEVFVLRDGETTPTQLTACNCVNYLAGGDDVLAFVHGDSAGELWISRAPFLTASSVWAPGVAMAWIRSDPDAPHHVTFMAGGTDALCSSGADIYYADLATVDTVPPRALTHDPGTQSYPSIRGDRVVYIDFAGDAANPTGCVDNPGHATSALVATSLANGGRTVLLDTAIPMSPAWLATDRVYLFVPPGLGELPLP